MGLSGHSFSFMCWVKVDSPSSNPGEQFDQTVVGQTSSRTRQCLHIVLRRMKPYFGFYNMDTASQTQLLVNTWYHLACVYDLDSRTQSIYLNGRLDTRSEPCIAPLEGNHELYYSCYASGRPLEGLLAAPLFLSNFVATEVDICQHMMDNAFEHTTNPGGVVPSPKAEEKDLPPHVLACLLPPSCYRCHRARDRLTVGRSGDMGLSGRSFSFMCWVKVDAPSSNPGEQFDQTVVGQNYTSSRQCLHIVIRRMKPYFGFYGMDTASQTQLSVNTWYHLACVYDLESRTQSIYLNGRLDTRSEPCIAPLEGNHELYYSCYAKGRPLQGLLAAPLFLSNFVATEVDICQHMMVYSVQHARKPEMIAPSSTARDGSWPPIFLTNKLPPLTDDCEFKGSEEFLPYLETGFAADATVRCNGASFPIHKIIVAARSTYFKSVFLTSGMKEQNEYIVELDDMDADVVHLFLKALYAGRVDNELTSNKDVVLHLLECCCRFGAHTLMNQVKHLALDIATSNLELAGLVSTVADRHELPTLRDACQALQQFHESYLV